MNCENAWEIWTLWRATDRRFLPSQLMDEPEALLSDMITLDSAYEAVRNAAQKEEQ